jgi:hypothetical protein
MAPFAIDLVVSFMYPLLIVMLCSLAKLVGNL